MQGTRVTAGRPRPRRPRKKTGHEHALEGLRDTLSLMLTRVIENDVDVTEARTMLAYLRKELDALESRSRGATRSRARRRRTNR